MSFRSWFQNSSLKKILKWMIEIIVNFKRPFRNLHFSFFHAQFSSFFWKSRELKLGISRQKFACNMDSVVLQRTFQYWNCHLYITLPFDQIPMLRPSTSSSIREIKLLMQITLHHVWLLNSVNYLNLRCHVPTIVIKKIRWDSTIVI